MSLISAHKKSLWLHRGGFSPLPAETRAASQNKVGFTPRDGDEPRSRGLRMSACTVAIRGSKLQGARAEDAVGMWLAESGHLVP